MSHARMVLGVVALAWLVAFLVVGGVPAGARATVHVLLAVACLLSTRLHDERLARLGTSLHVLRWIAVPMTVVAAGLLPMPRRDPQWGASLLPLGLPLATTRPEETVSTLAMWTSLLAAASLGALLVSGRRSTRDLVRVVAGFAAVSFLFALGHQAVEAQRSLGWFAPTVPTDSPFLPIVNDNHAAALANAMLPVLVIAMLEGPDRTRTLAGAASAGTIALVLLTRSTAGYLVMGATLLLLGLRWSPQRLRRPLTAIMAFSLVSLPLWATATGLRTDLGGRIAIWHSALEVWGQVPWWGTGGGGFADVVERVRADTTPGVWTHAHNDPLEWCAEHGLLGLAAWIPFARAVLTSSWRTRTLPFREALGVSVLAYVAQSLVDFPGEIPAVSLGVALLWGALYALASRGPHLDPASTRRWLVVLGASLLLGGAWLAREAVADEACAKLATARDHGGDAARARLAVTAPWRAEIAQYDLRMTWLDAPDDLVTATHAALARHPHDPELRRQVGELLFMSGDQDAAVEHLTAAAAMRRWDWRPQVLLARAATSGRRMDLARDHWLDAFRRDAPPTFAEEAWRAVPFVALWRGAAQTLNVHQASAFASAMADDGHPWEAADLLERVLGTSPRPDHRWRVARAWRRAGEPTRALAVVAPVVDPDSAPIDHVQTLLDLLQEAGRQDERHGMLKRVSVRDETFAAAFAKDLATRDGPDRALAWLHRHRLSGHESGDAIHEVTARLHAARRDPLACREQAADIDDPLMRHGVEEACDAAR